MAYDPEARESSNTAMVMGIVAVAIVVLGAIAWFATRPADQPVVVTQPTSETIIERERVEQPVTVPSTPNTVIVEPAPSAPATSSTTTTRTEVDIKTSPSTEAPSTDAPPTEATD